MQIVGVDCTCGQPRLIIIQYRDNDIFAESVDHALHLPPQTRAARLKAEGA